MVWVERLSTGIRPYLVILLLLLACALPGFFALAPLDRDESRFAQATLQMLESGDYVQIRFQDEARNKKPVGIHWLQAASVSLFGAGAWHQIQAYRLPSLLGGALCALAVFQIGALLYDRRIGLLAGAALAISLTLSTEAAIAKTDAMLAACIALSYWGLAALRRQKQLRAGPWLFWVGIACGALIKGPIGPLMLILTLGLLTIWERRVAWLRPLWHPSAVAVALLIVLPWTFAIWQATDGRFFTDAIGQDLAPKLSGQSENKAVPPGAHLLLSPLILWPASLLLPAALWTGWQRRRDARVIFLIAWIIPNWIMFEAAPAKLAHYTLPIHGALVLLGAIGLVEGAWQRAWVRWIGLAFFLVGGATLSLAPLLLAQDIAPDMTALTQGVGTAMALVLLVTWLFLLKRAQMAGVALVLSACVTSVAIKAVFIPALPQLHLSVRVSDRLVEAGLHPRLSPQAIGPLVGYGYQEPSLIFATRSDSALSSQAAAVSAARAGAAFVVLDTELAAFNQALQSVKLRAIPLRSNSAISGTNYSKGDDVTLIVGRIEALER